LSINNSLTHFSSNSYFYTFQFVIGGLAFLGKSKSLWQVF